MHRVAVAVLFVCAACSGKASPVTRASVEGTEMKFTPSAVSVAAPGKYRFSFVNRGLVTHELALFKDGEVLTRSQATAGKSVDLEVVTLRVGTYQMKCQEVGHEQAGMIGTITVEPRQKSQPGY